MGITSLKENAKATRVMNRGAGAASATPTKGTIIDMQGYESVLFIAALNDVLDTSAVALRVAGGDVSDTAQMTLLPGSAGGTAGASDYDNKLLILDVEKPTQRYLEAQLFHVTANAPFDSVIAIQYGARSTPVTQGSTVKAATTLVSPAA
ncbi:hypothetical protein [Niveispirillum sp.]|uniref:hypothetical protein n=1 Tax=Niveispirillum sp. TaxID=1917217 RepID=UPI001B660690|nr:hypothetical protein [Niveispirillum sp.]MBP7339099.1 hypothetical protein [Niveispirillum sp.]